MKIEDEVFGELEYEYGWKKEYNLTIFNERKNVRLFIENYDESYPEKEQKKAFLYFEKNIEAIVSDVEYRLFEYYRKNLNSIREKINEDLWDSVAPELDDINKFKELVRPTMIYIPQSFGDEDNIVYGIIFSCTWESECGIAVKFENEEVTVGTDDIILM